MTLTLSPASKMQHAPCRELSTKEKDLVFYPKSGTGYKRAKTMCGGCLDKDECLAQALSFEVPGEERYGIWGGLSARERDRLVEGREAEEVCEEELLA